MSSIFSCKRLRSLDLLTRALLFSAIATVSSAQAEPLRLGTHFRDVVWRPLHKSSSVTEVMDRLSLGIQLYVRDVDTCEAMVKIPPWKQRSIDGLRETHTIVQSLEVRCWVMLQMDRDARIAPTGPTDQITPDMIHGIMANAVRLSNGSENWSKTLTTFVGGTITCKDKERCTLSAPEESEWADYSLLFHLALVRGDERFIEVTELYRSRTGFVYGVRWRDNGAGGEVISIFPTVE